MNSELHSTRTHWGAVTVVSWALFCIAWTAFLMIDWEIRKSGSITKGLPGFISTALILLAPGGIIASSAYASRDLERELLKVVSVVLQGTIATFLSVYLFFWYVFAVIGDSY